jgi:hypothetical protein
MDMARVRTGGILGDVLISKRIGVHKILRLTMATFHVHKIRTDKYDLGQQT